MNGKRGINVLDDTAQGPPQKRLRVEYSSLVEQHGVVQHTDNMAHESDTSAPLRQKIEHSKNDQVEDNAVIESSDVLPPRASLLGMPREIRNLIYGYIFPSIVPRGEAPTWLSVAPPGLPHREEIKESSIFCLGGIPLGPVWWCLQREKHRCASLQINRQVRTEIFPVLLKDGYFHSWERSTNMLATTAWLRNLPSEHLELIRAISINLPGKRNPASRYILYSPVLPESQRIRITLYYFRSDYYLDMLKIDCDHYREAKNDWSVIETVLEPSWKYWHERDQHISAGGNAYQFDKNGCSSD